MPAPKKNLSGKVLKKILSSMPKPETGGKIGKQLDNVLKTQTKNLTKRNELIKEVNSAKANARGLKAATGKLSKGNAKRNYDKDKIDMIDKANPNLAGSSQWASHPGYASQKSNDRLQKGKWSSEKQIARYQKKEIKDFRKPKKK